MSDEKGIFLGGLFQRLFGHREHEISGFIKAQGKNKIYSLKYMVLNVIVLLILFFIIGKLEYLGLSIEQNSPFASTPGFLFVWGMALSIFLIGSLYIFDFLCLMISYFLVTTWNKFKG